MPGSATSPGRAETRAVASAHVAFRCDKSVGARNDYLSRLNGWPMPSPADASPRTSRPEHARLGADADRYSFIAADFHRLLLAGLPAHCHCNSLSVPQKIGALHRHNVAIFRRAGAGRE